MTPTQPRLRSCLQTLRGLAGKTALIGCAAAALQAGCANAILTYTIRQVGGDVVISGGGQYITEGLTIEADPPPDPADLFYTSNPFQPSFLDPGVTIDGSSSYFITGSPNANAYLWKANFLVSPSNFGGAPGGFSGTGSGAPFGVDQFYQTSLNYSYLILPSDNSFSSVSPNTISSTSTYSGQTIANLGLIPGIYTWKWGAGGFNQTLQLYIETPGPLPALGAASAFAWSRQLRRRIRSRRPQARIQPG